MNRTLLPSLSLSFLVCENGPTVPSQREVLRTTRGFAGVQCSGQFGGFRVRWGTFLSPHPPPQRLGDTCCPIAPAPDLGDRGEAVSRSALGPWVTAPAGTRPAESALPAAASQDEPASRADEGLASPQTLPWRKKSSEDRTLTKPHCSLTPQPETTSTHPSAGGS